jgi:ribosomal protein S12 methylthiotransferase
MASINPTIKNISVLTLGCSKNVVDSENLIGLLGANELTITDSVDSAETLIINTCGFIGPSKEESLNVIHQASQLKREGKIKQLIVMGCLTERYSDELKAQLPDVDHIFGVDSNQDILKAIKGDQFCNPGHRSLLTPSHYAYVKISEGCNHECSFCAIPLIRGVYRSRPQDDIATEIKELVSLGVKEFNIIAQDTTYYGRDFDGKSHLAELLDRISDIQGVEWLRLHYAYPTAFPKEILNIIAAKKNICNYIDIPFQHISDKILKSMRRGTNSDYIRKLINDIRTTIPDVAIRSTFIVGYPGETKQDFDELCRFLEEVQLDRVGVFTYSHEDGTHAFSMIDTVPQKIKEKRQEEIMLLQQGISLKKNQSKIGSLQTVLVDTVTDDGISGRTEHDAPDVDNLVHFTSTEQQDRGDFVTVEITEAQEYDIFGKISGN